MERCQGLQKVVGLSGGQSLVAEIRVNCGAQTAWAVGSARCVAYCGPMKQHNGGSLQTAVAVTVIGVCSSVALSACGTGEPTTEATVASPTTTATSTTDEITTSATSTTAKPTTVTSTTAEAKPQTFDVAALYAADFASPSGNLMCSVARGPFASCYLPSTVDKALLPNDYCAGGAAIVGIRVDTKVGYDCSGEAYIDASLPSAGGSKANTSWFTDHGVADKLSESTGAGSGLAVLPYGDGMIRGPIKCASTTTGVNCTNTATGASFNVSSRGVTTTGPVWDTEQGWEENYENSEPTESPTTEGTATVSEGN